MVKFESLGSWNPLFNLTAVYDSCTREAGEFAGQINTLKRPNGIRWAQTKEGCRRTAMLFLNSTYNGRPPPDTKRCWLMFYNDSFNPQYQNEIKNCDISRSANRDKNVKTYDMYLQ